jgi:hypothetical protein
MRHGFLIVPTMSALRSNVDFNIADIQNVNEIVDINSPHLSTPRGG